MPKVSRNQTLLAQTLTHTLKILECQNTSVITVFWHPYTHFQLYKDTDKNHIAI